MTKYQDLLLAVTAIAGMVLITVGTLLAILRHGAVAAGFGLFLIASLIHVGVRKEEGNG